MRHTMKKLLSAEICSTNLKRGLMHKACSPIPDFVFFDIIFEEGILQHVPDVELRPRVE